MLDVLKTHLTDLVNGTLPHFDHDRDGMPGFRGFRPAGDGVQGADRVTPWSRGSNPPAVARRTAKRALTGAAAIGFAAALLLARASHPGARRLSGVVSFVVVELGDRAGRRRLLRRRRGFTQTPQVQTHVS